VFVPGNVEVFPQVLRLLSAVGHSGAAQTSFVGTYVAQDFKCQEIRSLLDSVGFVDGDRYGCDLFNIEILCFNVVECTCLWQNPKLENNISHSCLAITNTTDSTIILI
jgi:hypothetical protein